jgi:hypothetical protein
VPRVVEMLERENALLRSESTFLRGVVEQQQRDAAELRAALREALRMSARALPASTSTVEAPEQLGQVGTDSTTPSAAAPGAPQSAAQVDGAPMAGPDASEPQKGARVDASTWRDREKGLRGWLLKLLRG